MKKRAIILILVGVVLLIPILFIALGVNYSVWGERFLKTYGYLGLFIVELLFSLTVIVPLAAEPLVVLAGGFMNPLMVGIIAGVGATIGESSAYFVGRSGKQIVKGKYLDKTEQLFHRYGFIIIPIFAFTPLPFDLIGIVAGVLRYDLKKFFLGALIGKIPRTIILAYSGYYGAEIIMKYFAGM